jgi:hypothetical protein
MFFLLSIHDKLHNFLIGFHIQWCQKWSRTFCYINIFCVCSFYSNYILFDWIRKFCFDFIVCRCHYLFKEVKHFYFTNVIQTKKEPGCYILTVVSFILHYDFL